MAGGALIRGLMFSVVQYNPLSAIQPGRAADIHVAYRHAGVIFLNGTRERRERPDLPVLSQTIGAFVRAAAGYSKHSNKCAGVSISVNKRYYRREQIVQIAYPTEPRLSGRALALRCIRATSDITFVNSYVPPGHKAMRIVQKLYAWINNLLIRLPRRTIPVLCTDANGHVGLIRGPMGVFPP